VLLPPADDLMLDPLGFAEAVIERGDVLASCLKLVQGQMQTAQIQWHPVPAVQQPVPRDPQEMPLDLIRKRIRKDGRCLGLVLLMRFETMAHGDPSTVGPIPWQVTPTSDNVVFGIRGLAPPPKGPGHTSLQAHNDSVFR
jgi:hypothetical protein